MRVTITDDNGVVFARHFIPAEVAKSFVSQWEGSLGSIADFLSEQTILNELLSDIFTAIREQAKNPRWSLSDQEKKKVFKCAVGNHDSNPNEPMKRIVDQSRKVTYSNDDGEESKGWEIVHESQLCETHYNERMEGVSGID